MENAPQNITQYKKTAYVTLIIGAILSVWPCAAIAFFSCMALSAFEHNNQESILTWLVCTSIIAVFVACFVVSVIKILCKKYKTSSIINACLILLSLIVGWGFESFLE